MTPDTVRTAPDMPRDFKLCIGLTGGIGCGKSTVSRWFETQGVRTIDTDVISHRLTQAGGLSIPAIRAAFGPDYITGDGALNRSIMRSLIFSTPDAKTRLEKILHPLILAACKRELTAEHSAPYTLLIAPLLLECPEFMALVQRVLLVDCNEKNQISRVIERSGLDESEIRAIIAMQMPASERLARADDIVQNDGLIADLEIQLADLHQRYKHPFDGRLMSNLAP